MSSLGVSYNGTVAPSSVFPSIFSKVNTYTIMVQINDASEVRRLVKANDSFNHESEINDTFPKNHSLFQFYINVEGNDHLNGFYSFDDLLCDLGKISEGEYINARDDYENRESRLESHISLKCQVMKEVKNNDIWTNIERVLDDEINELEEQVSELRYLYSQWEDQEQLLEHIQINLRKCIYWTFFNENQQKQYPDGYLFIPKISNETINLLDAIFNQSDQMDTITNKQINKHLTDFETVDKVCEEYNRLRTELGETVELLEATEEDDEESESESDDESVWETASINENENPDKSDASSDTTETEEDEDVPKKVDECQTCIDYHYLLNELRDKDKKIKNLNEIIEAQDKQIEEADDEEENEWEAQYNGLKEWVDDFTEEHEQLKKQMRTEKAEHNKTVIDYANRVNELIDEVRELRKLKNKTTDNI